MNAKTTQPNPYRAAAEAYAADIAEFTEIVLNCDLINEPERRQILCDAKNTLVDRLLEYRDARMLDNIAS